jgi:hypothetical protein
LFLTPDKEHKSSGEPIHALLFHSAGEVFDGEKAAELSMLERSFYRNSEGAVSG